MKLIDGIPVWGTPDEGAVSQIKTCAKTADRVALMADHHKGYAVPIGGVVAYKNQVSPSGVGHDIGCGNKQSSSISLDQRLVRTSARSWTMSSARSALESGGRIKKKWMIRYSIVRHGESKLSGH
jgi:RNA-splicing ligase RtcB